MRKRYFTAALLAALALGGSAAIGQAPGFWSSPSKMLLLGVERLSVGDFREGLPVLMAAARGDSPVAVAWLAHAYHLQRRLTESGDQYARLLRLDPPTDPTDAQADAILRFAPRVFQVPSDPFSLRDAVAIHHPNEPLIAYHFFWEDDIDFPEDNDPCDHELAWVRYDPATMRITDFTTYFHGRMLASAAALDDARQNGQRPRLNVQWGKHGSLPYGWEALSIQADAGDIERSYLNIDKPVSLGEYNRAAYEKLRSEGRRLADHPLGKTWPVRFTGTWEAFTDFSRDVDLTGFLRERKLTAASRWNNAAIQQRFLRYNFRPKTEWPDRTGASPGLEAQLGRRVGASLDRVSDPKEWTALRRDAGDPQDRLISKQPAGVVDLPSMSIFKPETPRYPNLWFYAPVNDFPTYTAFVEHVTAAFRGAGYRPDEVGLSEGADVALSVEHLQPWSGNSVLAHGHAVHIRLFWKRLQQNTGQRVSWGSNAAPHWRLAASVHYEVEHANLFHADVELCPICGRTGGYAAKTGNLVEDVHDPLGLEFVVWGTVRGRKVGTEFGRMPGVRVTETRAFAPFREEMNTETMALVAFRKG